MPLYSTNRFIRGVRCGCVSLQLINEKTSVPLMILAMAIFGTIGVMTHYIEMPASMIVLIRGSVGTLSLLVLVFIIRYRLDTEST